MVEPQEVTFSDLLQHPNRTVAQLKTSRSRTLLVHRRGAEDDLILTTATRAARTASWSTSPSDCCER
ncbi:hypothetical protein [Kribbella qitaiheensis]|uniref:hypothetical protein n=1 Tax=Kribbella qitaiheensis TaxID=1544730 RepID=UPI0016268DB2|nr:hypothetical protein [Kribbella qitaiheensis]